MFYYFIKREIILAQIEILQSIHNIWKNGIINKILNSTTYYNWKNSIKSLIFFLSQKNYIIVKNDFFGNIMIIKSPLNVLLFYLTIKWKIFWNHFFLLSAFYAKNYLKKKNYIDMGSGKRILVYIYLS